VGKKKTPKKTPKNTKAHQRLLNYGGTNIALLQLLSQTTFPPNLPESKDEAASWTENLSITKPDHHVL